MERDAALERQFQPVYVEPPSAPDTVEILRGLRERHEVYHGVRIADAAIEAAVAMSDRYVSGRYLPDKAVDLIDEAASRVRIGIECAPSDLDQVTHAARRVEIELIALGSGGEAAARRNQLTEELAGLRAQAAEMTARWRAEHEAIAVDPADQAGTGRQARRGRPVRAGGQPGPSGRHRVRAGRRA